MSWGPQGRASPLALRFSKKFCKHDLIASSIVIDLDTAFSFVASLSAFAWSSFPKASNSEISFRMGGEIRIPLMREASSGVKYGLLIYSSSVV
jgi:hypothetical protein